ncbi:MAG: phosphodiesterase [Pseudomonadota bacterium]
MFRLLHLTDTHLYADATGNQRGVVTRASLERVLEAALREQPDAVLVSGDLCQDESREGYRQLRGLFDRIDAPVICLPGNHDDLGLMQAEMTGDHIAVLGDHSLGHWRLLATDCTIPGAVHGEYGEARIAALDRALGELPTQPTLVALHHPPVPCGSRWLDQSRLQDGDLFMSMLARHAQVRAVLCGHIHQPLDETVGHIRVLATPSTCRQFASDSEGYAVDELAPGWRWLELGDHALDTHIDRLDAAAFAAVRV